MVSPVIGTLLMVSLTCTMGWASIVWVPGQASSCAEQARAGGSSVAFGCWSRHCPTILRHRVQPDGSVIASIEPEPGIHIDGCPDAPPEPKPPTPPPRPASQNVTACAAPPPSGPLGLPGSTVSSPRC